MNIPLNHSVAGREGRVTCTTQWYRRTNFDQLLLRANPPDDKRSRRRHHYKLCRLLNTLSEKIIAPKATKPFRVICVRTGSLIVPAVGVPNRGMPGAICTNKAGTSCRYTGRR